MRSFMDHIPPEHHDALRDAIDAVTESKILLDQVAERFGTKEPDALESLLGQTFDGVTVTPEAVAELRALHDLHETRRQACHAIMQRIAGGAADPEEPQ